MFRHFLSLAALVLLVTVVSIHAAPQTKVEDVEVQFELANEFEDDSSELEVEVRSNKILKKVMKILEKAFKGVAKHCLEGAAKHCKKYWYNPPKVISCATDFLAGFCQ